MAGSPSAASNLSPPPPEPELTRQGYLEHAGSKLRVQVAAASRLSLYVGFERDVPIPDRTVFPKLVLELKDRAVELSACRYHVEYTQKGYHGRLVFLEDVYDCRKLLQQEQLVNLKGFFHNLPLVLAQKDRIRNEFRDYTAAALYDLSVYKKFFNEQDRIFANEPAHVAAAAQATLIQTEGRAFFQFFDRQLDQLKELVKGFDKEEHERHGFYFRRHAWEFILGSEVMKRTNLKPRGYAGDAEIMQMVYENGYVGNYVFNKLLHKHPLEQPAAQAVRNRRRLIPRVLREVSRRFPTLEPGGFRFLSLASGPATELQDLFRDEEDIHRLSCALLDQDTFALLSAREGIERIEAARDVKIRVEYFNDSVRTMLRTRDLSTRFGRFHFIYSMGLFDYLTPPVARAIVAKAFDLLHPGGTIVIGNYHVGNPTRVYMEYWMDWVLYYRTEEDFLALAAGLPGVASVSFDESGTQMFLQIDKPT